MSRIHELHELGQSIWLDYIDRGMLQSGELNELVNAGLPRRDVRSDHLSAGYLVQ